MFVFLTSWPETNMQQTLHVCFWSNFTRWIRTTSFHFYKVLLWEGGSCIPINENLLRFRGATLFITPNILVKYSLHFYRTTLEVSPFQQKKSSNSVHILAKKLCLNIRNKIDIKSSNLEHPSFFKLVKKKSP